MQNELGPKPAGNKISFAPDCFVKVSERPVWTVANPTGWGYPAKVYSESEAKEIAAKKGWQISEGVEAVMQRVKWF